MSKLLDAARRRWKAILGMTALFVVGVLVGTAGSDPASADVENVAAPLTRTITVDGEPVTVTTTKTRTIKKRVVKWRTTTETVTVTDGNSSTSNGNCHPSYKGECLDPSVSDYDCASGTGDGPGYVYSTVRIVGYDEYDLDGNDNDGLGCE